MCIKWTIRIREEGSEEGVGRYIAGYQTKWKLWILIVSIVKTLVYNKTKHFQINKFSNWRKQSFCVIFEEDWKKGEISIRCTTHDDKWLLQQAMESSWDEKNLEALVDYILPRLTESKLEEEMVRAAREGKWEKEKVQALLCQKSTLGTFIFSMLDFGIQQEAAFWNPGATNKIGHLMPQQFIHWLIQKAKEGTWSKK